MAIQFVPGQVALSDPYPNAPTVLSNPARGIQTKVVKLSSANFSTGTVNTQVAMLPADATILSFRTWVRTQLAGNSISAATLAIGNVSGGAQFSAANAAAFGAAGVYTVLTPVLGICQNYQIPNGPDIPIWVSGVSTTGTPTSGEIYLIIEYVR